MVGLGYCTYDILTIVPGLPEFDDVQMTHVAELVDDGGGQVGTALTALARLGVQTGYLGALGDDREGRWLRCLFEQEGVDLSRLRVQDDIGTTLVRCVFDSFDEIGLFVVDRQTGAKIEACLTFLIITGSCENGRTHGFGKLDRRRSDAR